VKFEAIQVEAVCLQNLYAEKSTLDITSFPYLTQGLHYPQQKLTISANGKFSSFFACCLPWFPMHSGQLEFNFSENYLEKYKTDGKFH